MSDSTLKQVQDEKVVLVQLRNCSPEEGAAIRQVLGALFPMHITDGSGPVEVAYVPSSEPDPRSPSEGEIFRTGDPGAPTQDQLMKAVREQAEKSAKFDNSLTGKLLKRGLAINKQDVTDVEVTELSPTK
jgi:hypothetical protein